MISNDFISKIKAIADSEIDKYGVPSHIHFMMSYAKGKELSRQLNAREDLVALGTICMDIKLGVAFQANKLPEHVQMSLEYTKELLESSQELTNEDKLVVYNSIEAHHGAVPHTSLESEIVTNADCYRFIHPTGVTWYNASLGLRFKSLSDIVRTLDTKLEEKWKLITLPIVKEELKPYYEQYKRLFEVALKTF